MLFKYSNNQHLCQALPSKLCGSAALMWSQGCLGADVGECSPAVLWSPGPGHCGGTPGCCGCCDPGSHLQGLCGAEPGCCAVCQQCDHGLHSCSVPW